MLGSGGVGYGYDANGNLKSDTYKGITNITYNYLNLPSKIQWGTSKSIDYVYDASGQKLSKTVKTGSTVNSVHNYCMGVEYNKLGTAARKIEAIYHEEGRYFNTSTTTTPVWRKEYSIKDHLGNTRLTFTDKNSNGLVDVTNTTSTEILQENHYYAFGMTHEGPWLMTESSKDNAYQYNGKEFNNDHGLNWSDYGARYYDACLGRFTSVDPLADKFPGWSPYNYTLNNPINMIDPDGRAPETIIIGQKPDDDRNSRKRTFNQLQSLTSQKLSMDRSGKISIGKGTVNNNASAAGTSLIANLVNDESKTINITNDTGGRNVNLENQSVTIPNSLEKATNGEGTGSTILFSPDVESNMTISDGTRETAPSNRVLGHELFHSDHNRTGTNAVKQPPTDQGQGVFPNREEQNTVAKENQMFNKQRFDGTNGGG